MGPIIPGMTIKLQIMFCEINFEKYNYDDGLAFNSFSTTAISEEPIHNTWREAARMCLDPALSPLFSAVHLMNEHKNSLGVYFSHLWHLQLFMFCLKGCSPENTERCEHADPPVSPLLPPLASWRGENISQWRKAFTYSDHIFKTPSRKRKSGWVIVLPISCAAVYHFLYFVGLLQETEDAFGEPMTQK